MKRNEFLKTVLVLGAVPFTTKLLASSYHEQAVRKLAEYIDGSVQGFSIGLRGMYIPHPNVRKVEANFISRHLKYKHEPVAIMSHVMLVNNDVVGLNVILDNEKDFILLLNEIYPHLKRFNKKDIVKKFI